jgi:next-to-BRCA1 protein 1
MTLRKQIGILPLAMLLSGLLLSACGGTQASPTPTQISVEAIYTAAAQTLAAQITETALSQPTETPTPEPSPTQEATATTGAVNNPIVVFPTPTTGLVYYYTPAATSTPTVTGTPPTTTPTATATYIAWGCNNAQLVSDLGPSNGSSLNPGASFRKTWRIKNNGTCEWVHDFKFTFVGGALMGSDTFKIRRTVPVDGVTEIFVDFVAPTAPGTYTGYWRMATNNGNLFGVTYTVQIVIPGATHTPTKTATVTPTSTKTPVPPSATSTSTTVPPSNTPITPTSTPEPPTNTPEPTATETATTGP